MLFGYPDTPGTVLRRWAAVYFLLTLWSERFSYSCRKDTLRSSGVIYLMLMLQRVMARGCFYVSDAVDACVRACDDDAPQFD